jgi:hypothetical protein
VLDNPRFARSLSAAGRVNAARFSIRNAAERHASLYRRVLFRDPAEFSASDRDPS